MGTTMTADEAAARREELTRSVLAGRDRVTITSEGQPVAVLLSVEDLESLEETLYWQSQPGVREAIEA